MRGEPQGPVELALHSERVRRRGFADGMATGVVDVHQPPGPLEDEAAEEYGGALVEREEKEGRCCRVIRRTIPV